MTEHFCETLESGSKAGQEVQRGRLVLFFILPACERRSWHKWGSGCSNWVLCWRVWMNKLMWRSPFLYYIQRPIRQNIPDICTTMLSVRWSQCCGDQVVDQVSTQDWTSAVWSEPPDWNHLWEVNKCLTCTCYTASCQGNANVRRMKQQFHHTGGD